MTTVALDSSPQTHLRSWSDQCWVLPLILLLTVCWHLPGLGQPLLGNFAARQSASAFMARNFAEGRSPWYLPAQDELRGGRRGVFLLEFPLSAYLTGILWKCCGGNLDAWGRGVNLAWWLVALISFHSLLKRWHHREVALGGTLAMALAPIGLWLGHSFHVETSLVAFSLLSLLALERALGRPSWSRWLCWGLSITVLGLGKIYLFYLLPVQAWRLWTYPPGNRGARFGTATMVGLLAMIPVVAWYGYTLTAAWGWWQLQPEEVYFSIVRSGATNSWPHPLLLDPNFYKQLLDDLVTEALTPIGIGLAVLGLSHPKARSYWPWMLCAGIFVMVLPRKFYEMEYYWGNLLPLLCAIAGLGWQRLTQLSWQRWQVGLVVGIWALFSIRLGIGAAYVIPPEDRGVLLAADSVQRLVPSEASVVTLHGTCPILLYYCDRTGYLLDLRRDISEQFAEYQTKGIEYFVVANLSQLPELPEVQRVLETQQLIEQGKDFALYRLTKPQLAARPSVQQPASD